MPMTVHRPKLLTGLSLEAREVYKCRSCHAESSQCRCIAGMRDKAYYRVEQEPVRMDPAALTRAYDAGLLNRSFAPPRPGELLMQLGGQVHAPETDRAFADLSRQHDVPEPLLRQLFSNYVGDAELLPGESLDFDEFDNPSWNNFAPVSFTTPAVARMADMDYPPPHPATIDRGQRRGVPAGGGRMKTLNDPSLEKGEWYVERVRPSFAERQATRIAELERENETLLERIQELRPMVAMDAEGRQYDPANQCNYVRELREENVQHRAGLPLAQLMPLCPQCARWNEQTGDVKLDALINTGMTRLQAEAWLKQGEKK